MSDAPARPEEQRITSTRPVAAADLCAVVFVLAGPAGGQRSVDALGRFGRALIAFHGVVE